jgi:uncharacterized protein YkwD
MELEVTRQVFSLRKDAGLPDLSRNGVLNRIAARSAKANLLREAMIEHTDSSGKNLATRTQEESYDGATGEIVSVIYLMCSDADGDSGAYRDEVAVAFKQAIRNSSSHYHGLMSQTGKAWNEFGMSIVRQRETIDGFCMEKTSLSIVLGESDHVNPCGC